MTSHIQLLQVAEKAQPYAETMFARAQYAAEEFLRYVRWMNRKVLIFTKPLPKPCALLTYHLWKSTPYIIMGVFLPTPLYIIGIIYAVAHTILTKPLHSGIASVKTGIGFSELFLGTYSLISGAIQGNPFSIVKGCVRITIGSTLLINSGLVYKIIQAAKEISHPRAKTNTQRVRIYAQTT